MQSKTRIAQICILAMVAAFLLLKASTLSPLISKPRKVGAAVFGKKYSVDGLQYVSNRGMHIPMVAMVSRAHPANLSAEPANPHNLETHMATNLTAIASLISAIGGTISTPIAALVATHSSSTSTIQQYITELHLAIGDPVQVASIADKIISTPGVSIEVALLAQQIIKNSSNPSLVLAFASQITTQLAQASSNVLSNLFTSMGTTAATTTPAA